MITFKHRISKSTGLAKITMIKMQIKKFKGKISKMRDAWYIFNSQQDPTQEWFRPKKFGKKGCLWGYNKSRDNAHNIQVMEEWGVKNKENLTYMQVMLSSRPLQTMTRRKKSIHGKKKLPNIHLFLLYRRGQSKTQTDPFIPFIPLLLLTDFIHAYWAGFFLYIFFSVDRMSSYQVLMPVKGGQLKYPSLQFLVHK